MEKIILVDGNNLLFRSYYATAYNGNFMKNSKGFPTNALFGFTNMINKILTEEKPTFMIVAFDKGKTFRHAAYKDYKGGRGETPEELKLQFPLAKELLTHMGIKYYECDNYEADDILGTFAEYCDSDPNFIGTVISSDKDLLQLISDDIDIKLLKQKDHIRYNKQSFKEAYNIDPINIIDLKALMGDPSDNIPGVKGIGEKTALKLLQDYHNLDNLYNNLDKQTPKIKEKLEFDKENAYLSYNLATIVRNVPMDIDMEDTRILEKNQSKLNDLYEELEFYSFLKKDNEKIKSQPLTNYKIIENIKDFVITKPSSYFLEIDGSNYHTANVIGMGIYNDSESYYIPASVLKNNQEIFNKYLDYTYDFKKNYVALKWNNIDLNLPIFDTMIAGYLLDYNVKDDIAYLANNFNYEIPFVETIYKKGSIVDENKLIKIVVSKAKFIYETYDLFNQKLVENNLLYLFNNLEMPLSIVLGNMEYNGVNVDKNELEKMKEEILIKIELNEKEIYNLAGTKFNISSPKQLGEILFEKLQLPHGKKTKTGYSTAVDTLNKLQSNHPIINKIIEYRMLTKLYTTYIEGLINVILDDNKIHTIYTQTLTRTGRLSSIEPNLQNIPIRYEYGKLIRKAFIPSKDSIILSGDYSQIELRILSHMANVENLIEAFKNEVDIHIKTASDIFKVEVNEVTKNMRRIAKAVNFGIIYGISSFGLSENIGISPKEAKEFIDNYLETYPGIKEYMDKTICKAHKLGYVETLMNRKRNIPELLNKNKLIQASGERMALNTPIQGTSADIIKKAMIDISNEFKNQDIKSKMILQVHDELVFDMLIEEKEKVIEIITNKMENVITLNVPLKIEIESGINWYQAK
ncbi:MAG: DNA polymerase I [Bacilli bacterium]